MLSLLNTIFAKTPATGNDPGGSGEPASLPADKGNQGQGGALNSDAVQISRKEYQDLLSLKGYHTSFQSNVDKRITEYEQRIADYEEQLRQRGEVQSPPQKSALEQILEKASNNGNDNVFGDEGGNNIAFLTQALQALQSDVNSQLSSHNNEIQRLNKELQNTKNESLNASRTTQRKSNIDSAMNVKINKLMDENKISYDEAIDYAIAEEDVLAKYVQAQSADDNTIGTNYVDETLGAVRQLAKKMNELEKHKLTVEQAKAERESKIDALLEGDKKQPERIIIDMNKEQQRADYGLSQPMKGESKEDFLYRQIRERTEKLQSQHKAPVSTGFK